MGKHTPGPWNGDYYTVVAGDTMIADCCVRHPITGHDPAQEHEANARLIAAAPDLLAESKAAVLSLADMPHWLEANGAKVLSAVMAERLAGLRAAIAKADGDANAK